MRPLRCFFGIVLISLVATAFVFLAPGGPALGEEPSLPSLDPDKRFGQYVFKGWQKTDGLPSNQIRDIVQDRDGYLWLATTAGLARFDGVHFESWSLVTEPTLQSEVLNALVEGTDGSLWVGSTAGLLRYREGRFTAYPFTDVPEPDIQALVLGWEGGVWAGGSAGLWSLHGEAGAPVDDPMLRGLTVSALAFAEDTLWIGTEDGKLFRRRQDRTTRIDDRGELSGQKILALAPKPGGELWIGTEGAGLFRSTADDGVPRPMMSAAPADIVAALLVDRSGRLWIGANDGLLRFDRHGGLERADEQDLFGDDRIRALYEDREGHLWIGSYAGGLVQIEDGLVTTHTPLDGLSTTSIRSVFEDRQGRLWVGTFGGGLNVRVDDRFETFTPAEGFPADSVWSIAEDHRGTIWLGTDIGLLRSPGGEMTPDAIEILTTADGLSHDRVRVVLEDPDEPGSLWLGTIGGGVNRLRDGEITVWDSTHGLPYDDVRFLHKASNTPGDFWIGTFRGLSRLRDGRLTTFTTNEGLSGNLLVSSHRSFDGALWLGTIGAGLTRLHDGRFFTYTTRDGLSSNSAWWLLEDDDQGLWFCNDDGLYRVDRPALERRSLRSADLAMRAYGLDDGLKTLECNGGGFPAAVRGRDGSLWFATMAGLASLDPAERRRRLLAPDVRIERIVADGDASRASDKLTVPAGTKNLVIHYTTPVFRNPEDVSFRYFLEGYDESWSHAGPRRVAYYTHLRPGDFVFRVRASNGGVKSEAEASIRLTVEARWHQTPWFRGSSLALLLFGLFGGYKLRTRTIRRRTARLEAEIDRRQKAEARLATAVRDLRAKNLDLEARKEEIEHLAFALSHDLKNPLVTIKGFLGRLRRNFQHEEGARISLDLDRIDSAASKMERLINAMLEVRALENAHDPSDRIVLVELVREVVSSLRRAIEERGLQVTIAPSLPTLLGDRRQIRSLFHELVTNVLHYLGDQPHPRLEIEVGRRAQEVVVTVRDNGMGIDPRYQKKVFDLFERLEIEEGRDGIGLALARRIVMLHGGRIWIESEGLGDGTTVCLVLPWLSTIDEKIPDTDRVVSGRAPYPKTARH